MKSPLFEGGDNKRTVVMCKLKCAPRLLQVGASHHELLAPDVLCTLYNVVQVTVVNLFAMVTTREYGITQVDSNLESLH